MGKVTAYLEFHLGGNRGVEIMSDRRWVLNRKCFAALRAIGDGTDKRWNYIHVGPKGVTATDTVSLIRVSLPDQNRGVNVETEPAIFDYDVVKKLAKDMGKADTVTMPEGLPAKSTGQYTVPNHDVTIPKPEDQTATITVDAERLIELLKGAMEVTEHNKHLVRLRFYKDFIRIDSHRDIGGQEFLGLLMWTNYNGNCIPGDAKHVITGTNKATPETANDGHFKLPVYEGRKFREVEESE
jgi:hypothetical protein